MSDRLEDILKKGNRTKRVVKAGRSIVGKGVLFAQSIAGMYRTLTDWAKPTIDKVVDPAAVVIGSNLALSTGVYYANREIAQPILDGISGGSLYHFIDSRDWLEFGVKTATYGVIYGVANAKIIIPVAKRFISRDTTPSWANHAKTWAILGTCALAWNMGIEHDYDRIKNRIKRADGIVDTIGAVFDSANIRILDRYLSGKQGVRMARQAWRNIGYDSPARVGKDIEQERERIRKYPVTSGTIAKDAGPLIKKGIINSPQELAYVARVVYFEGAYDPKAKNLEEIKDGIAGISNVMYNRFLYDKDRTERGRSRGFSRNDNLYDVVFHHGRNKYGGMTWQFSAIPDRAAYFSGEKEITKDGAISLSAEGMNADRAQICYEVLLEVLNGQREDNTDGSLFYQNPTYVDKHNRDWKARGLNDITRINSHVFFRPNTLSEDWREEL